MKTPDEIIGARLGRQHKEKLSEQAELLEKLGKALAMAKQLSLGPTPWEYSDILVEIDEGLRAFREWKVDNP